MKSLKSLAIIAACLVAGAFLTNCATTPGPEGDMDRHLMCVGFSDAINSAVYAMVQQGIPPALLPPIISQAFQEGEFDFTQQEIENANRYLRSLYGGDSDGGGDL